MKNSNKIKIKDIDIYTSSMHKSLSDKIFFINKLYSPIKCIIDYGCADGALIHMLYELFPEYIYIGYDTNTDMLSIAKQNAPEGVYYSCWNDVENYMNIHGIKYTDTLLNLSSVIHEIYNYSNENDIENFWNVLTISGFKYISIRDIGYSKCNNKHKYKNIQYQKVKNKYSKQVKDFEKIYGNIENGNNLSHFLLKYKYVENWDREVKENYFIITPEEIINKINFNNAYNIIFQNYYVLSYLEQKIDNELDLKFDCNTHYQLLFYNNSIK